MRNWRPILIQAPDFQTLSDEELEKVLRMRDGPWSTTIRSAMAHFGATSLDLNSHWASEHQGWVCPGCNRSKPDLLRLTKQGVLKANLEIHHDHLADYFKGELRSRFGIGWSAELSSFQSPVSRSAFGGQKHVDHLGVGLLERFERTLICSDCNTVDGLIKSKVPGIDKFFSLRPSEIAACIVAAPRTTHRIDIEKAAAVWKDSQKDYEDRKSFAVTLLEGVARGAFCREQGRVPRDDLHASPFLLTCLNENESNRQFVDDNLLHARLRSEAKPPPSNVSPPKRKRRGGKVPTDDEWKAFDGRAASTKWKNSGSDWLCPICERSKRQLLRWSKSKEWFAGIYDHVEVCAEFTQSKADAIPRLHPASHHHVILICADCRHVESELRRRHRAPEFVRAFLTLEQIGAVIQASPHQQHEVDWERAAKVALQSPSRLDAKDAYWNHWHEVRHAHVNFKLARTQYSTSQSFEWLVDQLQPKHPTMEDAQLRHHVRWLLTEAKRLPGVIESRSSSGVESTGDISG